MNEIHKKGRVQCFTNRKDLKGDLDAHSTRNKSTGHVFLNGELGPPT
jgi:hypothetical protein